MSFFGSAAHSNVHHHLDVEGGARPALGPLPHLGRHLSLIAGPATAHIAATPAARLSGSRWAKVRVALHASRRLREGGVHSLLRSVAFTLGAVVAAGCISFVSFDYLLSNTHSRHGGTTSVAALLTFCELVFALVGMIAMGPFPWFHFPTLDIALRNNASGEAAIPMRYHLVISALEFIQSLCQNLALDFAHLPLPLFLVAANSGVAFNVAIGALCLGKRFSTGQLLGVALVVAGVLLAVSSKLAAASTELTGGVVVTPPTTSRSPKYTAGAALLVLALLAGSVLGVLRDREATRFGRHAEETFFWSNTINALLYVVVMGGSLLSTATQLHTSSSGPTGTAMATVTMRFRLAFCLFLVLAFVKRLAIFRLLALAHALSAGVAITCFKTICVVLAMARRNTLASITLWAGLLSALFGSSLFGLYCSEASVQFGVVAVDDAEDTSAGGSVAIAAEVELGVVEASRDDDDPR